jgi:hypothetical protein
MDPITNQQFSHDYQKFVLQDPNVRHIYMQAVPKPFSVLPPEKTGKSKKDMKKQRQKEAKAKDTDEGKQIF